MSESLTNILVTAIVSFIFGGGGMFLLQWIKSRKVDNAVASKAQSEADKIIREEYETSYKNWQDQQIENTKLILENETNKHLLRVQEEAYSVLFKRVEEVLIRQGRQEKSEEICQEQMRELKKTNESQAKQISDLEARLSSIEKSA